MLKKTICLVLVLLMAFTAGRNAFAAGEASARRLQFDENGDFTILHLTDWHCDYPLPAVHRQVVLESIAEAKPDLVVLGGAVSVAEICIVKIWKLFVDVSLPFWGKATGLIYNF